MLAKNPKESVEAFERHKIAFEALIRNHRSILKAVVLGGGGLRPQFSEDGEIVIKFKQPPCVSRCAGFFPAKERTEKLTSIQRLNSFCGGRWVSGIEQLGIVTNIVQYVLLHWTGNAGLSAQDKLDLCNFYVQAIQGLCELTARQENNGSVLFAVKDSEDWGLGKGYQVKNILINPKKFGVNSVAPFTVVDKYRNPNSDNLVTVFYKNVTEFAGQDDADEEDEDDDY